MASSYCWAREPLLSSLRIIQAATWRLLRSREWRLESRSQMQEKGNGKSSDVVASVGRASLLTCRDKMPPPWLYRVLSVYLCWCSNPTEWELRCRVPCVVVPIQPRELSCGVPHVDVPFQLSDFSFLFLFFFLPMISQGCNLCIFLLYQLKLALFCAVRSKKIRVENKLIWNIYL